MAQVRRFRHWKQRFDPNAEMRFRKNIKWSKGVFFKAGDPVPPDLLDRRKLHRWWEAGLIELCAFEEGDILKGRSASSRFGDGRLPASELSASEFDKKKPPKKTDKPIMVHQGAGWYDISFGGHTERIRGKKKAEARLAELES